ncbi:uncharacterized protein BCR38DRAFT_196365 [Pseudomassariella vexata]|uniref:Uncharacterized protein n=1 Tax=Pseudomassariella vexata TaxID=1141098 RepID=A0A1Y2E1H9_9PEZI|nr:uncharacterized protein BCR38DRAFT_196365 [Pseudomassariella vexata]ORY65382.1 hypothetical protein BCR38DRAFT_196365 [Pseudomassariella vexata]
MAQDSMNPYPLDSRPNTSSTPRQYIAWHAETYRTTRNTRQNAALHLWQFHRLQTQATIELMRQPAPIPLGFTAYVEESQLLTGLWLEPGTGNTIAAGDVQLPSSFDNLQAYLPLMFNNFSLPFPGSFGDLAPKGNGTHFGHTGVKSYLPPPTSTSNIPGSPQAFAPMDKSSSSKFQRSCDLLSWVYLPGLP